MEINKIRFLGSVNIGLYAKASNYILLYYAGIIKRRLNEIVSGLEVTPIPVRPLNTRVISPFIVLNNRGVLISKYMDPDFKENIKMSIKDKGVNYVELDVKYTAIGNLIVVNDKAALVSPIIPYKIRKTISDELDVEVSAMTIGRASYVGSLMIVNNKGGLVAPFIKDDEYDYIKSLFNINLSAGTINNGIPFISSGIILNDKAIYVGDDTVGRELLVISQAFGDG